jgi:hypothetical protein
MQAPSLLLLLLLLHPISKSGLLSAASNCCYMHEPSLLEFGYKSTYRIPHLLLLCLCLWAVPCRPAGATAPARAKVAPSPLLLYAFSEPFRLLFSCWQCCCV